MNRLDRLVLGRFLAILSGCLLAISIVFVAVDYVGASRIWSERTALEIRRYYLAALPYILFLVSPIAVLLSGMFTVAGFARRQELMAMRGAGRPLWRILLPVWIVAVAYSGAWSWIADHVMPDANHVRVQIRQPKGNNAFRDSPYRVDFAFKAGRTGTLFFREYSGETRRGSLASWTRTDSAGRLDERIDAREAAWRDGKWIFRKGILRSFDAERNLSDFRRFDSLPLSIPRSHPDLIISTRTLPDELTRAQMLDKIAALRLVGEPTRAWEAEAEFRRSSPWVTAIVALIGTALAALVGRRGQALSFGVGILLAFSFYVALRVALALGHAGALSPPVSAWGSHAVFLLLGLGLLWRASRT